MCKPVTYCSQRVFYLITLFLVIYVLLTCFAIYSLYSGANITKPSVDNGISPSLPYSREDILPISVEIWGKAAVGGYLWEHILGGTLEPLKNPDWYYGRLLIDNVAFTYRSGPAITPDTVPPDTSRVIIALNGRSEEKIRYAKTWLDSLKKFSSLRKVGVLILGDEKCQNDWILPYLASRGGPVNVLYLIYDSKLVNGDEIVQWPLGVAIYRKFPKVLPEEINLTSSRKWSCNFLGTVYPESSRATLMNVLEKEKLSDACYTVTRNEWVPNETEMSLNTYLHALEHSDLTLSPVGKNTECYRFLEALSYGSIPVVEDVRTSGECSSDKGPLRLLKAYGAPFIYVKHWSELKALMMREHQLSSSEKIERRLSAVRWYQRFKVKMRRLFMDAIERKLL